MKKLTQLKNLVAHEDNDPLEFIKVIDADKQANHLSHYVNIHYCCFNTGWGGKDPGNLKDKEKKLLDSIKVFDAVFLKVKFGNLEEFIRGFSREMHWINQMPVRIERFKNITKVIFDKVETITASIGDLETYIKKNFGALVAMLPVNPEQVKLEALSKTGVLELLKDNKITVAKADELLHKIDVTEKENNSDKLCPFSGSGRDPDQPTRICSRTGDPKKLGDCGSCRVAAEWEEVYG